MMSLELPLEPVRLPLLLELLVSDQPMRPLLPLDEPRLPLLAPTSDSSRLPRSGRSVWLPWEPLLPGMLTSLLRSRSVLSCFIV